jgi:hypothetical protein
MSKILSFCIGLWFVATGSCFAQQNVSSTRSTSNDVADVAEAALICAIVLTALKR